MQDPRIEIVAEWLSKQVIDSSITDYRIMEEIGVSNGTYYKLKKKAIELNGIRSFNRQKHIEAITVSQTAEAVKTGLKSKLDRTLLLQQQIQECLDDLNNKKDKPSIMERVSLRRAIKELQSEISKIEGDYAVEKKEITGKDGQPLTPTTIRIIRDNGNQR